MKYVKRYVDRNGDERLYFRKKGHARHGEALRSPWPGDAPQDQAGSPLAAEVAQMLGTDLPKRRPSTLAGATRAYELNNADFKGLAPSTKYEYRLILKEFDADFGALHISAFTPGFIQDLRDAWSGRGHRAANVRLQVLKNVLSPALIEADLPDPFSRIKQVRRPHSAPEPHPIWSDAVVRTVIGAAIEARKFGLARAVALGRYAGARRGDLVKVPLAARRDGRIAWLSGKRKVPVDMPEDPLLTFWLAQTPAAQPQSKWQVHRARKTGVVRLPPTTIVFNTRGVRYTEDGLGQELADLVARLHLAGRIDGDGYDLHGLRHTFGVEAAIAGCSDAQGAALMGHSSPHSFAQYRRQAARLRLSDAGAALIKALRESEPGTAAEREVSNECLKVSNPPRAANDASG